MFQVIKSANRLVRLEEPRFYDLKLRERKHLQEWLAHTPEALGEELLVIQKEFDGFADTRERLDLLALDKEGRLVVIENKLDDSGRDVVWQALKYAAYCSNLKRKDIPAIYQKYLDRTGENQNAEDKLRDFLEVRGSRRCRFESLRRIQRVHLAGDGGLAVRPYRALGGGVL